MIPTNWTVWEAKIVFFHGRNDVSSFKLDIGKVLWLSKVFFQVCNDGVDRPLFHKPFPFIGLRNFKKVLFQNHTGLEKTPAPKQVVEMIKEPFQKQPEMPNFPARCR